MINVGSQVKVNPPFKQYFPGTYNVLEKLTGEDGSVAFVIDDPDGIGVFASNHLEEV